MSFGTANAQVRHVSPPQSTLTLPRRDTLIRRRAGRSDILSTCGEVCRHKFGANSPAKLRTGELRWDVKNAKAPGIGHEGQYVVVNPPY